MCFANDLKAKVGKLLQIQTLERTKVTKFLIKWEKWELWELMGMDGNDGHADD